MSTAELQPIISSFASDPEMLELVEIFVSEVPDKVDRIRNCESSQNWDELKRAAHQLKGSAGGYGFDALTPIADQLERSLQGEPNPERVSRLAQTLVSQLLLLRSH
jgi:HPt (histidine-containing phosphotransfer) domain-containing protein